MPLTAGRTLRKFAPALIEALQFRSTRAGDPMLGALKLLAGLNQSGKREVPADAPMPFRKEWRRLVMEEGGPNRRLYETAVLATLRDKPALRRCLGRTLGQLSPLRQLPCCRRMPFPPSW